MARRSVLFSPGDRESLLRKAAETRADVIVFDLEDAVAPNAKEQARETVCRVLSDDDFDPSAEVCVRVNRSGVAGEDLDALERGSCEPDSIMVPKVGSPDDLETVSRMLAERNLNGPIMALLETADGILHAEEIAASERVTAVIFGAEDLAADIGATRTESGTEVLYAREHVVLAASAAGVDAIDTVYTDYEDVDGLEAETRFAAQLGFDGKLAIHPAQVGPINRAFTPDSEEVEWARRVLAASEEHDAGVFAVDGEMIDRPLIARAERVRALAEAAGIDLESDPETE